MSGLLALLDDVAALTRLTAASLDDIAANAAKASSSAIGVVIDDAAVTPTYVHGVSAARELPMIGRIAIGSLRNKILLAPALLLMSWFWPTGISVLLLVGGAWLCFEGAEKVLHSLAPRGRNTAHDEEPQDDPARLEEARVSGAIKTDFILSAEIMTVALAAIGSPSIWMQAAALLAAGVFVTIAVYGAVAIIVKLDDVGLFMARAGRLAPTRATGRAMVKSLPVILTALTISGTIAMIWVGGGIVLHALHALGVHRPSDLAGQLSGAVASLSPNAAKPVVLWLVDAILAGLTGLVLGMLLVLLTAKILQPILRRLFSRASTRDA